MAKTTLKDVAEKAGIAFQTVSKILNNGNATVSSATRERVLAIANELNYRPNQFARSLKKGKTGIIGVTFPGQNQFRQFSDPYLSQVYAGIGSVLAGRQYKMAFHGIARGADDADQSLELAQSGIIDGLIYILFSAALGAYEETVKQRLHDLRVPVVLIHSSGRRLDFPAVGMRVAANVQRGVAHLLGHGYGDVGLVVSELDIPLVNDFRRGYADAMDAVARPVDESCIFTYSGWNTSDGVACARRIIEKGRIPRALFVQGAPVAYGLIRTFRRQGVRVPEDVAVLAMGEHQPVKFRDTDLALLEHPAVQKGQRAAELLVDALGGSDACPQVFIDSVDRYRTSCGCPPADLKSEERSQNEALYR